MMTDVTIDSCEDDLSALFRVVLAASIQYLGWTVPDQSRGGFTAKGNPGERDLLIEKNGTTLAVIEAVVCSRPLTQEWMRGELTSHFQKLFAYDQCVLFFHLTYAYIENPASTLVYLKQTAEKDVPAGFQYVDCQDIPHADSQPVGFIAQYTGEFGPIKAVFLVLDMGQHHQREAAKTAANSNPRH
jgi:hypothetical protein